MTREDFLKKISEDDEYAPGWDCIDDAFEELYPDQKPDHYGTIMTKRAIFGGEDYLDGFSIYCSPKGYRHIVTYGMTELYAEPDSFGGEWSRWGYEMTIKLSEPDSQSCMWAIDMLSNLARYTYTTERFFEPRQFVAGNGSSIKGGAESMITALLVVEDTEAKGRDSVYGRVDFLQLVGITETELSALKSDPARVDELISKMLADNPDMVTDMARTKSYIE